MVAEVFGPVGGVGDFDGWAEDGFDVGGEGNEGGHEGVGVGCGTDGCEAAKFGADAP